jgi:hypothetical protein
MASLVYNGGSTRSRQSSDPVRVEREKRKAAREARAWEREKILYERILTPNVMRLVMVSGIIAYSTYCARSKENVGPVQSALAIALPGIGIPIIAADAGIRDKYALAAISAAGIGYTTDQMLKGWKEAGVLPSGSDLWEVLKDALPEWVIPG